jgi:hypothetical protein
MVGTIRGIFLLAVTAASYAQDGVTLEPPKANGPVVQDGLIGTWQLYDIDTNAFEPTGTGIITITATTYSLCGEQVLPNSEADTWLYMFDGLLGENTDAFYLPFCSYTYDPANDYLIICETPGPSPETPGAAVFKRICGSEQAGP